VFYIINYLLAAICVTVMSTGWPKKVSHKIFVHIFVKYWPILKIFSLVHSGENL